MTTALSDFIVVLAIGGIIGMVFTRYGRTWLGRHMAGTVAASDLTYILVGIAGAFIGYHIALIIGAMSPVIVFALAAAGAAGIIWLWRGR